MFSILSASNIIPGRPDIANTGTLTNYVYRAAHPGIGRQASGNAERAKNYLQFYKVEYWGLHQP